MKIKRIRIVSNNISYGPCPAPEDEVEQHLTITADGRVFFSAYAYGAGFGAHTKIRVKNYKIDAMKATRILDLIDKYYSSDVAEFCDATDIGSWQMSMTVENGKSIQVEGSLCFCPVIDGIFITKYIRSALELDDLLLFDGIEDEVDSCLCPLCDANIAVGACMEVSDHFDKQPSTTDLPSWVDEMKEEEQRKVCQRCSYHCY